LKGRLSDKLIRTIVFGHVWRVTHGLTKLRRLGCHFLTRQHILSFVLTAVINPQRKGVT
jgi:hypothetical protein